MCGIAGFIDLAGGRALDSTILDRMVDAMYLRGPDDRGTAIHSPVAMGMRRLSIIDLAGGQQPIENEDGSIRVVMNGEIFNYQRLRSELVECGHGFRTQADTEVLVHGYEEWGLDGLLERLNGMYAIALQDDRRERCYLVRDRLGIKPLLYAERDGYLWFGSAMSALLASGAIRPEPDPLGLRLYLHHQFIPGGRTALAGVRKLPPGTYLDVHGDRVSGPVRYWDFPRGATLGGSYEEHCERLRKLLADAVAVHMVSDVEVGLFLSGGLDSSIVLGLMAEAADRPVKAYSIAFEDKRVYDESKHARQAAERFGAEYHETVFTPGHVLGLAERLLERIEEPLGDAACLPTLFLAEQAAQQVKVVLSGEGADELFAGYDYYKKLPPAVHAADSESNFVVGPQTNRLKRWLLRGQERAIRITRGFHCVSPISGYPYAMNPHYVELLLRDLQMPGAGAVDDLVRTTAELERSYVSGIDPHDSLRRALLVDASGWLPENLLTKVDRTTMAHSLEARVPFLDYRCVELASSLPSDSKLRKGTGKAVLRDGFRDVLGEGLANRKKHGFNLPMADWIRGELRPLIEDAAEESSHLPWLNAGAVRALVDAHQSGRFNFERPLWCLFVLVGWFRNAMRS